MGAMERKRCRHCAGTMIVLQIEDENGMGALRGVAVCGRCDGEPADHEKVFLPRAWD